MSLHPDIASLRDAAAHKSLPADRLWIRSRGVRAADLFSAFGEE
jgi:hypothetical protein